MMENDHFTNEFGKAIDRAKQLLVHGMTEEEVVLAICETTKDWELAFFAATAAQVELEDELKDELWWGREDESKGKS